MSNTQRITSHIELLETDVTAAMIRESSDMHEDTRSVLLRGFPHAVCAGIHSAPRDKEGNKINHEARF